MLLSFTHAGRPAYLLLRPHADPPISGGVAFPVFSPFGIKTILLNMLQLGFLLSTLRVGSVVRDKDVAAGPVRPRRRLRVSFTWENA